MSVMSVQFMEAEGLPSIERRFVRISEIDQVSIPATFRIVGAIYDMICPKRNMPWFIYFDQEHRGTTSIDDFGAIPGTGARYSTLWHILDWIIRDRPFWLVEPFVGENCIQIIHVPCSTSIQNRYAWQNYADPVFRSLGRQWAELAKIISP